MTQRIILIGDVHGCVDELRNLLDHVEYDRSTDDAIVVGDLVDRGPDSIGVISLCMERGVRALMGNHDEKHVRHARNLARHPDSRVGFSSDEERGMWSRMSDSQRDWLSNLPNFLRVGPDLVAVHAGMLPGIPVEQQPSRVLHRLRYLESRSRKDGTPYWEMARMRISDDGGFLRPRGSVYWTRVYDGDETVFYGHNVSMEGPVIDISPSGGMCVGIDTGACFGGRLTAAIVDTTDQSMKLASVGSGFSSHRERFYEGEYDPE